MSAGCHSHMMGANRLAGLQRGWLRLTSSQLARQVANNSSWLMGERLMTMFVNLGVGVLVARYLGAEDFGVLSYVVALVALLGFLSYLGLDSTVTRRLAEDPQDTACIMGTAFVLRMMGSLAGLVIASLWAFTQVQDSTTAAMIVVIAAGMLFQPAAVVDFFFQSQLKSRYPAIARTVASLLVSAINVVLVLAEASLLAFAIANALQQVFVAVAFLVTYRLKRADARTWHWQGAEARRLFKMSWPLFLSSATGLIFLKIDQVMLGEMVGEAEVGVYAVAARLSEVWFFIPAALTATFLPVLVRSRKESHAVYERRLQIMYDAMVWFGIALASVITVIARPAVDLLYGEEYAAAGAMLQVSIWISPLMFAGGVLARWAVMEGQQMSALIRNSLAAGANIGLNLVLIPRYGGLGAAWATLLSYGFANYFGCLFYRPTWGQFRRISLAFLAPIRVGRTLRA